MFWKSVAWQVLGHVRSARFFVGILLTLIVTILVMSISVRHHFQQQCDYDRAPYALEGGESLAVKVFRSPRPLSTFCEGSGSRFGHRVDISWAEIPVWPTRYSGAQKADPSPTFSAFSLDFSFVVGTLLSLLVLFLTHDTICGEIERGTLPLLFAAGVGRAMLVASKMVGAILTAELLYALCMTVGLAVTISSPAIAIDRHTGALLALIYFCGAVVVATYAAAGVLVSSFCRRSASALLAVIFLWVGSVIVIPGLGSRVAVLLIRAPQERAISASLKEALEGAKKRRLEAQADIETRIRERQPVKAALQSLMDSCVDEGWQRWLVWQGVLNRVEEQHRMATIVTALSPMAALENFSSALAGTDWASVSYFMAQAREYQKEYAAYVRLKKTDPQLGSKNTAPTFGETFEPIPVVLLRVFWLPFAPFLELVVCLLLTFSMAGRLDGVRR